MSINLFLHNQNAYQNAVAMLDEQGKAAIIHPTGTGKSFIAFKLAEDNSCAKICWFAPSEYIFRTQRENFLRAGGCEESIRNIYFFTYSWLMWNEEQIEELKPNYIILDEFHRCGASEWGRSVDKLLVMYPKAKVLGLSATNVRYLDAQRDMADELFEGRVASRMSLGEAIAGGILPAPVYVSALYSYGEELKKLQKQIDGLKNQVQQRKCEGIMKKLTRSLQRADGPDRIFQKYMKPEGKYLVFCAGKEHMDEMMELAAGEDGWFRRVDENPHIYQAYYDNSESRTQFQSFCEDDSGHLKLLYCIDMLNEGIHVADVDGVVLLRPTISPILYLQQVGRALSSKGHGTKEGDAFGEGFEGPVIFDMVNNFDGLFSIDFLKDELEKAFFIMSASYDGGWQERFRIYDEVKDCKRLFEQLQINLSASWDIFYQAAEQYYKKHGNLDVHKRYITDDGLALGNWLLTQRRVRRGLIPGSLTKEKIAKLDRLGMRWESYADVSWMEGYRHLLLYIEENNNANVPARYVSGDGYFLGSWLNNQRMRYLDKDGMSEEQIKMLEDAGVVWSVSEAEWRKYYLAAEAFYKEHGNLSVPAEYVAEGGLRLGAWIGSKRRNKDSLSAEKIAELNSIGMVWDTYSKDRWKINYSLAEAFYKENGHLNVPKDYTLDGVRLGRWVGRMRERRKPDSQNPLTDEQIKSLDAIGMIWDSSWDIRFGEAKNYYEKYGNLRISQSYVTENRVWLGKWVYEQRRKYKKNGRSALSKEQINKLESIGMVWN